MKKPYLKILLPVLISSAVILLNIRKAESCGPYLEPDEYYSVFDKSLFDIPDLKPFFLSEYVFADQSLGSEDAKADNLASWVKFAQGIPAADHIRKIVYETSLSELRRIADYVKTGKANGISQALKNNSFIKFLRNKPSSEIMEYIIFAKEAEPEVSTDNQWEEKPENSGIMFTLAQKGKAAYKKAASRFIKERYAYQTIRLLHYSGKYQEAVNYYDDTFKQSGSKSLMKYWSLAHKAGAMQSLGDTAGSNILFASVFENCRSRRRQSILSVKLNDEAIIRRTLELCRDNNEKALVCTMAAYRNPSMAGKYMESVYSLAPESDYLVLLLQRELTRLEREMLPTKANWSGHRAYLEERDAAGGQLFKTVSEIAQAGKTGRPYLWNFAAGYIATLSGRTEDAEPFYLAAKKSAAQNDLSMIRRVQIAESVNRVTGIKSIDRNTEDALTGELKWLQGLGSEYHAKDALVYIMNKLARLYLKQNNMVKVNLCLGMDPDREKQYSESLMSGYVNAFDYDIRSNYHIEPVDSIFIVLAARFQKDRPFDRTEYKMNFTSLDSFLIDNYSYSINQVEYIQAKSFIAKGDFKAAAAKLQPAGRRDYSDDNTEKLSADPFIIHIRDCHDCDYRTAKEHTYTVQSFVRRMIELTELAEKDRTNSAGYYFLYANGLYNKTFYGNAWLASSFSRTSDPWGYYDGFNYSLYDCSEAQKYYLKAMNLAKDKEFAAKCLFMASKCELNSYYSKPGRENDKSVPLSYRQFFGRLKEEYSDTKYYQEILSECRHFRNFVFRQQ